MSRKHVPYYEDEGLMEIVDYSTPRRGEDLTSPNAPRQVNTTQPRDTVIVPSTPAHRTTRVIDDQFFITERIGPITLGSGDVIDALDLSNEAGEIVSIEVVTDNPYTGVYLELDDYRNYTAEGVTAAELLMRNRVTPTDTRDFYAEDMREDGNFVVKYSPSSPQGYTSKVRVQVRNDVRGTNDLFSLVSNNRVKMRAGLPTPRLLSHAGGWYLKHQEIAGVAGGINLSKVMRKLGPHRYESPIRNMEPLDDANKQVGAYSPYMNTALEVELVPSSTIIANVRMVGGKVGETVSSTSGAPTCNTIPWPGRYVGDTFVPSEQQYIMYLDRTEDETGTAGGGTPFRPSDEFLIDAPMYFKKDDTIYFPGKVQSVHFYDAGTSAFVDFEGGDPYVPGTDGAAIFTVSPGLPFKPPKVTIDNATAANQLETFGTIDGKAIRGSTSMKVSSTQHLIQEVIIRRKRSKTLLL
ncbi:MAG: hypothetical protein VW715_06705 [Rhodospirillales bacterium]